MSNVQEVRGPKLPGSSHDLYALLLAIGAVFLIVQLGAPVIRNFEFLDPKLRDYSIGMSFAAFPWIHGRAKQALARMVASPQPSAATSAPWFVAGVMAAAVTFGWNQFVSLLSGMSMGVLLAFMAENGVQKVDPAAFSIALSTAAVVCVLPLSAVAAVFSGMLINRYTRSHVVAAVALSAVMFVSINVLTTLIFQPQMLAELTGEAPFDAASVLGQIIGFSFVGFVMFLATMAGVGISRLRDDRSIGQIVGAVRRLAPVEREALARQLANHVDTAGVPATEPPSPPPAAVPAP